jgi:hypothetical protein
MIHGWLWGPLGTETGRGSFGTLHAPRSFAPTRHATLENALREGRKGSWIAARGEGSSEGVVHVLGQQHEANVRHAMGR